ncbi:hypothetical protein BASA50_000033 [Batrachochytrium salamandrivorans]|uniref:Ribosomal protein L34 n=1 Tax=Batrachochytrium salamandrivorans TaxID=1357716 RepID=A0ABQ8EXX2_9FUNG|nr:hypothetical protein BASA62_005518 [Batrachochytrium salamandrivorans]KAH6580251.1 hypothetical protein BASA60_002943 [Batrachochytrium salamandrivorans]KAH6586984.1 hypothetical protein BASA50_000033 [Batrachochytrium salamandrivorans]KAH6601290.1 hypothetical protein BASA61_002060 [Batrachochytrium salamandrivorans]KAH9249119.1 ribosomal protein L34 [Batrachochytrium salamandrivorans]
MYLVVGRRAMGSLTIANGTGPFSRLPSSVPSMQSVSRQLSSLSISSGIGRQLLIAAPTSISRSATVMRRALVFQGMSVRHATYGQEYQPSTLVRKRRFGFLARLKTLNGRKILKRRMIKGRKRLTH